MGETKGLLQTEVQEKYFPNQNSVKNTKWHQDMFSKNFPKVTL